MDRTKENKDVQHLEGAQDGPQVIAEIRIVPPRNRHEEILEEYNHCALCGTELLFTHVTNFVYMSVDEEAHCPSCSVRTIKQEHKLH
ncbi:MAG: hypothetical protein H6626_05895 [Pseudobdellovibrionaceae bacterium]|nr:hypothetical protein [Bdellovibrionales bacterium]USN48625.1 MAG: hypothetical protein H6626_05895 [Pseudobdellovibrionaceae bacterium]